MTAIEYNKTTCTVNCPVFNGECDIELGTCVKCKYNLLGDFIKNSTGKLISKCLN